jgi:hypothetical protein
MTFRRQVHYGRRTMRGKGRAYGVHIANARRGMNIVRVGGMHALPGSRAGGISHLVDVDDLGIGRCQKMPMRDYNGTDEAKSTRDEVIKASSLYRSKVPPFTLTRTAVKARMG